jgi:alpha-galactosidase
MAPIAVNLDPLRDYIEAMIYEKQTLLYIQAQLLLEHQIQCSTRTILRRTKEWATERPVSVVNDVALQDYVFVHFWKGWSDNDIVKCFKIDHGQDVSERSIRRIRTTMKLLRRMNPLDRQASIALVKEAVKEGIENGHLGRYGRVMIHEFFRTNQLLVTR